MSKKIIIDPVVYLWRNLVNCKVYVGSSVNEHRRKTEHILRLNKGESGSLYFQRSWDKYGQENFEYNILERCTVENRLEREQYWIDKLQATNEQYGYNLIPTRTSQLYGEALSKYQVKGWAKHTKEKRREINAHLFDPVTRQLAFDRSNEAKKGPKWRAHMDPIWERLRRNMANPEWKAALLVAQNEGRARVKACDKIIKMYQRRYSLNTSEDES